MLTMALRPGGETAATCHGDGVVRGGPGLFGDATGDVVLWDLSASPPRPKSFLGSFKRDMAFYMTPAAAFSPDGRTLAFADSQHRVELWEVTADPPKQRTVLPGQIGQPGTLAFAPDGKTLAAVGNGVLVWDLSGPEPRRTDAGSSQLGQVVVSPDGRRLATVEEGSGGAPSVTRVWDLTGAAPRPLSSTIGGWPLVFGTDGLLLTAEPETAPQAQAATLRRWDVGGEEPRAVGAAAAAPMSALGGRRVITGTARLGEEQEPQRVLRRLDGSARVSSCTLPVPRSTLLHPTAVSADGNVYAASMGDYKDRVVKIWDVSGDTAREKASVRGEPLKSRTIEDDIAAGRPLAGAYPPPGPRYEWTALALAPDGRAIALANGDGTFPVWSLAQGAPRLVATLRGREPNPAIGGVKQLAFAADGRRLLAASNDRLIVWDIASGKTLDSLRLPGGVFGFDAAFAPDGRHIITANSNGTVYILRLPEHP
jgi:WD40 repeat protein